MNKYESLQHKHLSPDCLSGRHSWTSEVQPNNARRQVSVFYCATESTMTVCSTTSVFISLSQFRVWTLALRLAMQRSTPEQRVCRGRYEADRLGRLFRCQDFTLLKGLVSFYHCKIVKVNNNITITLTHLILSIYTFNEKKINFRSGPIATVLRRLLLIPNKFSVMVSPLASVDLSI